MNKFLLASYTGKLSKTSGQQGKKPYEDFETFFETVGGFPIITQTMSTFYATNTTVAQHDIATLFPFTKA
jgi:hypothetical protein